MWFELKGDARLGRCATDGCGGQPTARLEVDGIGSNYCSGCQAKIMARDFYGEVRTKGDLRDFKTGDLHLDRGMERGRR